MANKSTKKSAKKTKENLDNMACQTKSNQKVIEAKKVDKLEEERTLKKMKN